MLEKKSFFLMWDKATFRFMLDSVELRLHKSIVLNFLSLVCPLLLFHKCVEV